MPYFSTPTHKVADQSRRPSLDSRNIEDIRTGQRVLAVNPQISSHERDVKSEPNWADWFVLDIRMKKQDGSTLFVELMRPESWILDHWSFVFESNQNSSYESDTASIVTEKSNAGIGPLRQVFLQIRDADSQAIARNLKLSAIVVEMDLPELDIVGPAIVTRLEPVTTIDQGEGCVVTATFKHTSSKVLDLYVAAEENAADSRDMIGTTSNHPFWSVERQDFVQAGQLEVGETLRIHSGEHRKVLAKVPRQGLECVYNLEVWGEHVYFVGKEGILVHNTRNYIRVGGTGENYNERTGQGIYVLRDADGNIRYVGRGDAPQRLEAHAQPGSGKEDLKGEILFNNNLPEAKAKSLEQELMHMLGGPLSINPGTSLRNKIQGIGEGNPNFTRLEFAAGDELVFELLRRAGLLGKK